MHTRLLLLTLASLVIVGTAVAAPTPAHVAVRSTSLGSLLVDARGHTLYVYGLDKGTKSACTGACSATWPPFLTTGRPAAGAGVAAAKLGSVRRADGKLQVTFAGHPLYFYAADTKAGDVKGASLPHWAALSATGAKLRAGASSSSSGGYQAPPATTPPDYGNGGY